MKELQTFAGRLHAPRHAAARAREPAPSGAVTRDVLRANGHRIALAVGVLGAIAVFVSAAWLEADAQRGDVRLLGDAAGASWVCLAAAWAAAGMLALGGSAVGEGLVAGATLFVLTMVARPGVGVLQVALAASHALALAGALASILRARAQWRLVLSGAALGMAAPFLVALIPWLCATHRAERWARGGAVVLVVLGTSALARGRTWSVLALGLAAFAFSAPELFPNAIEACLCWSHPLTDGAGSLSALLVLATVPWLVPIARSLARPAEAGRL